MVKNLIKKSKINVYSMVRHGSVAVITLFLVGMFFGVKNVMLAFPIALTSTVMGRQNFQVKTFNKAMTIIAIDLIIVIAAHISSLNLYIGIPINFISVFLIMYTIVSPYDLAFYKPFLMLFVFTQYAAVPTSQLYLRIMAVLLGVGVVILASVIRKVNEKSVLGNTLRITLKDIHIQLINILQEGYDKELQEKCSMAMRELAYKIYVTRHREYLTTNLGKIQFRLFISIEYLNLALGEVVEKMQSGSIYRKDIIEVKRIVESILDYIDGKISLTAIEKSIKNYKTLNQKDIPIYDIENEYINADINHILSALENIIKTAVDLDNLGEKEINKIFNKWERTDIDKPKVVFKEYFDINSIRFKFALRMSLTMTVALFLGELLGYYKVIWAIITIMSIMQPYYEDTKSKAKERVIGNVLAILITGVIINVVDSRWVTISILIVSLYLLFGFKEYYKISLFAGMASMCIASLNQNINVLIFYRILYVIIGVIAVMIINSYVFPYKLRDGIDAIAKKMLRLRVELINAAKEVDKNKFKEHEIRDLVIHSTLLSQKLYLRNLQCDYQEVEGFMKKNNRIVIGIAYNTLRYSQTKAIND